MISGAENHRPRALLLSVIFSTTTSALFYYLFTTSIHRLSEFPQEGSKVIEIVLSPEGGQIQHQQQTPPKQTPKRLNKVEEKRLEKQTVQKQRMEKTQPEEKKPVEQPAKETTIVQHQPEPVKEVKGSAEALPTEGAVKQEKMEELSKGQQPPPAPPEKESREATIAQREVKASTDKPGDDDAMKRYYELIYRIIERRKYYPEQARRRGEQGTPVVRISISGDGSISGVSLVKSSGSSLLDAEAVRLLKSIGKLPPPPEGKALTINVAIEYILGE